jgi:mannobiose 2-epimerase
MKEKCFDKEYPGVFWSVDYQGNPVDTTKHTYNQAFAIYALCAYFEASNDVQALELAYELFHVIEDYCTDEYGYLEAFKRDFSPESNEKLSENGVIAEKTMNTLLHVLEAYTQLYKISKDNRVRKKLYRICDIIKNKVYNPQLKRQEVFFDKRYNSILDLHSYGHDIETAWLVDTALEVLDDDELSNSICPIIEALTEQTLKVAFDGHSIANECENGVVNNHRVWWVQAEAIVGLINGWEKDKSNEEYLLAATSIWGFIKTYVVDKREGSEWYWEVDENGKPYEGRPIVEPWKCPYHNGRMCFEIIKRLSE